MRRIVTGGVLFALLVLLAPGPSSAQMREWRGEVSKIGPKEVVVTNDKGDRLAFQPAPDIVVQGAKNAYGQVQKKDRVVVSWQMMDQPRIAYRLRVLPPEAAQ